MRLPRRKAAPGELAAKSKDGKVGFINPSGEFVVPPSFDDALPFSDGLAAVKTGDKWGFVDTDGRQVIPPHFKAAYYFQQGIGLVESDAGEDLCGRINNSGKVVWGIVQVMQEDTPILGWTEEDKTQSCQGISDANKQMISGFPVD